MKMYFLIPLTIGLAISIASSAVFAQTSINNSTDAGRFYLEQEQKIPELPDGVPLPTPEIQAPTTKAPDGAKDIEFVLNKITIEGNSKYQTEELEELYKEHLNQKISLNTIWAIADSITKYYQEHGYFISRAYIPAQEFADGVVTIKVVEGYVNAVLLDDPDAYNYIVQDLVDTLKEEKPLNISTLESIALRFNDIHGAAFSLVIQPIKDEYKNETNEGAVNVIVTKEKEIISGSISVDNYSSKFTGPFEDTVSITASPTLQHETSLTWLNSMPWDRIKYFSANHSFNISSIFSADIYGSYTESKPGFTLEANDIESNSSSLGFSFNAQIIRQRQENLILKAKLESRDTATDLLNEPLTRDHIRVARISAAYDRSDPLNGYNFISTIFTQGLTAFDASEPSDINLSRTGVDPKFRKFEFSWTRYQTIGNWTGVASTLMQFSNGSLYASEQIGYGGQSYGRAYDSSEIIGDQGMLASFELRYQGIPELASINFVPYSFYDLGKVWDKDDVASHRSSAGFGIRLTSKSGIFCNLTVAYPIAHSINTPLYGNGKNPRLSAQLGYKF